MKNSLLILGFTLALGACHSKKSSTQSTTTTTSRITYEQTEQNHGVECTTGRHTSTTREVVCQTLGNASANRNCGADFRLTLQNQYRCSEATAVSTGSYLIPGCEKVTGTVHFVDSQKDLCSALQDEFLNQSCESAARAKKAKESGC